MSQRRHRDTRRRRAVIAHDRPDQPPVNPLIIPRSRAATLRSVSTATLIRMEQAGTLRPLKLTTGPSGMTFYRMVDIERLVGDALARR